MTERNNMRSELRLVHLTRPYHAVVGAWREPVVLACSGGVDSTALLLLAARARRQGKVGAFTVVHVDHLEREESTGDAEFVAALCDRLTVPFQLARFQARVATVAGASREAQLREARYNAIAEKCALIGVRTVVTAHTLNDQAETILMRLIAGSGTLGIAGMSKNTDLATAAGAIQLLRPLLTESRVELERVLAAAGVTPRHDESNDDTSYRRNALRALVMPVLREIEPGFEAALVRSAMLARDDGVVCDELADLQYEQLVERIDTAVRLPRGVVRDGKPAIVRRILRRAILEMANVDDRELGFERVEALRVAAGRGSGKVIELPGAVAATIERKWVVLMQSPRAAGTERLDA